MDLIDNYNAFPYATVIPKKTYVEFNIILNKENHSVNGAEPYLKDQHAFEVVFNLIKQYGLTSDQIEIIV